MIGIYRIINTVDGKCYVGQSIDIQRRFKYHERSYNNYTGEPFSKLYDALYKYGLGNFRAEILELCKPEELDKREVFWIAYCNSFHDGYNMTVGGGGSYFGENHYKTNLTNEKVLEIVDLLANSDLSIREIADIYELNTSVVSGMNIGTGWRHVTNQISYPIRPDPFQPSFCEVCGKQLSWKSKTGRCHKHAPLLKGSPNGNLNEDTVSEMKFLLKNDKELGFKEIAGMYGISERTLTRINYGESWTHVDENLYIYPIREYVQEYKYTCKICGIRISKDSELGYCKKCAANQRKGENNPYSKLTVEKVLEIKKFLKYKPDYSINSIANKFGVARSTIQAINKGKTWSHVSLEDYVYPIRKDNVR